MSSELEINELVKAAQTAKTGDEKVQAIEKIYKKLQPFRFALAKKFSNKGVDFDDIVQQIDLKLIEAIYDYEEEKDPSALRHLTAKARNGIWNYYRKEMNYFNKDKATLSLEDIRYRTINNDPIYNFYDTIVDEMCDFNEDAILERIMIQEELEKLTPHQKEILFMCFIDDMTQYDIAEELRINQSNVSRAKKRGIQSIRDGITLSDETADN